MRIISLFSGCGGLDLGFVNSGFKIVYANDFDKKVSETYEKNHKMFIDTKSIVNIESKEIPEGEGIIGGPPCQSWSLAGKMRGSEDSRGSVFYEYIRILENKKPKFFVAENVPGILSKRHIKEFEKIILKFKSIGFRTTYNLIDSRNYGVPQERKRVIIVGYHEKIGKTFKFPSPTHSKTPSINIDGIKTEKWLTIRDAIGDLPLAVPAKTKNHAKENLKAPNHEYMIGGFSSHYLSRNRRRSWEETSYTIQAGGRHAPLHPGSSEMRFKEKDKFEFVDKDPHVKRLSIRECARIQTFPDSFIFYYNNVADGYKMVGNAVPVKLATAIANKIKDDLFSH
jgi:DNA (cytosine-5)-methyltransferase 1